MKKNKVLSADFNIVEHSNMHDSRFVEIEVDVLHTGLNRKGWIFPKNTVYDALHTLSNTPIVAFVQKDENGMIDFDGHNMSIGESEEGEVDIRFVHQAFGLVPESFYHEFINKKSSDGVTREYLRINALLWTKWGDPIKILERTGNSKVSMEIEFSPEDITKIDEDKNLVNNFVFTGICLLGEDVLEGITDAETRLKETSFSLDSSSIKKDFEEMLKDMEYFTKGGSESMKEVLMCSNCETQIKEEGVQPCDCENFESVKFEAEEEELEENVDLSAPEEEEFEEEEPEEKDEEVDEGEESDSDETEELLAKIEELEKLVEELQSENELLKEEVEELKEYKEQAEDEKLEIEINSVFSKYEESLQGVKEFEELKNNTESFSNIEELKSKIGLVVADNISKLSTSIDEEDNDKLEFSYKPIVDNIDGKSKRYVDLVDRYTNK